MATLTYTKTWSNGDVLTHTDLNANFDDIKDLIETTKLDTNNLSTPYSIVAFPFFFDSISSSAGANAKVKVPTGHTYQFVDFQFSIGSVSNSDAYEADMEVDGSTALSSVLSRTTAGTSATAPSVITSATATDIITIKVNRPSGTGTATDVTAVLIAKSFLIS